MGAAEEMAATVIYVQSPIWIEVFTVTCGHYVHKLIWNKYPSDRVGDSKLFLPGHNPL